MKNVIQNIVILNEECDWESLWFWMKNVIENIAILNCW